MLHTQNIVLHTTKYFVKQSHAGSNGSTGTSFRSRGLENHLVGNSMCCDLCPVPVKLLKQVFRLPIASHYSDGEYTNNVFLVLNELKTAVVSQLLKKTSTDLDEFEKYHPVSSLPRISKIIAKVVFVPLHTHMNDNS